MTKISKLAVACSIAATLALAPAAQAYVGTVETEEKADKNKPKKITDRNHPDYVRCRSEPIIGSLARKKRVCMTNKEWAKVARQGNEQSRRMVEDSMSNASSSN